MRIQNQASEPIQTFHISLAVESCQLWESAEALDAHFEHPNFRATGAALRVVTPTGGSVSKYRIDAADGVLRAAVFEQPVNVAAKSAMGIGAGAVFPLRAADLPHLTGADLGVELRALEQRWIDSGFSLTKAELLQG